MKYPRHTTLHATLLASCLAAAFSVAQADETTPTTTTTSTTTSTSSTNTVGTSTNTEAELSAEFADFLGGQEQASEVVSGLRQGTAFSLDDPTVTPVDTTSTSTTSTTSTIDPPTGTMGYGNVRITLRLAQAELNQLGITQPTNEQLSAILVGGEINGTQVDGILTMRADGMGWGQIAKEYGTTVGQIMGKGTSKQPAPTPYASTQEKPTGKSDYSASTTTKSGQATQSRSNGYIPSSKSTSASSAHSNGYIPSGSGKSHGAGIVTAAGGSMGGSEISGGKGQSHKPTPSAQGAGVVSAGGQQVSMSGASSAGGGSKASAPGQVKKN